MPEKDKKAKRSLKRAQLLLVAFKVARLVLMS